MTGEGRLRVSVTVVGVVQGVGFRYATEREARRLHLTGWVRNTHDGHVEILADGPAAAVRELLQWCHRGPAGACVRSVRHAELPSTGPLEEFHITY